MPSTPSDPSRAKPLHVAISLGNADVSPVPHGTPADVERIHHDLVRQLVAAGHIAVYGGDLKPTGGGLTEQLLDIAASTAAAGDAVRAHPEQCLRNAVAWPIHLRYTAEDLATLHMEKVFENYEVPSDLGLSDEQRATFVPPDTPERRVWWARSFAAMREKLNASLDARVVVCGRGIGSSGAVPGILEEVVFAVKGGTPLFLVGGFGGVAVPLIEAFTAGTTSVFCREAQLAHEPMAELYAHLDRTGQGAIADFAGMVATLHQAGIAGLRNGLSEAENQTLFTTTDWQEASALLIEGLERLRR
ncbi:MAG: hypothetical protein AAF628_22590 [Planctomycetota bacterium]